MAEAASFAPSGACVCHGIPFSVGERVACARASAVTFALGAVRAPWLVFMHTADRIARPSGSYGDKLAAMERATEHLANYVLVFADGAEHRLAVRRERAVGSFTHPWGSEMSFEAVIHHKAYPIRAHHEQPHLSWGKSQTRNNLPDMTPWLDWLWAVENPFADKAIAALRIEPVSGCVILSALAAGRVSDNPLRWRTRKKAVLTLPKGKAFDPALDQDGLLAQIRLDLGQVISARRRPLYPNPTWAKTYNNQCPEESEREILVEYASHADAAFHLSGRVLPAAKVESGQAPVLAPVTAATQRVAVRVTERGTGKPVAARLHVHGESGEYLAPVDRHRIANEAWLEDYSVEFVHWAGHRAAHLCTYVSGETRMDLPVGKVYMEVSKGFEMKPVRTVVRVGPDTTEIAVTVDKVLPWRENGWVTADTHVHFLSPGNALVEGAAEGVNVVNLLASQWGELMTNVGDFDGRTTHGDGEYLVRVGTENRQHVLGHISLLGYDGNIIAPMTTGGPDESALGDPIEVLLTEWARRCHEQNGVVVIPHFPAPRCEHAATIVAGDADAVEMTSWGNYFDGIDPYSLADWYRYLNCGYFVAAVGGTDKMSASTAIGTIRTYAKLGKDCAFDYDSWKEAVRRGNTFVTYGPLMELAVDGHLPGDRITMSISGGHVDVTWQVASVTVPMSKVELVVNGEIRERRSVASWEDQGSFRVRLDKSSWLALLVRGHYRDKPEIIAAHSSPVMVRLAGSEFYAAADAMTILAQIEGAMAFFDTLGTRAQAAAYRRMRLVLTSVHRALHNRMHAEGRFHEHKT
jgi:hypothetical protein